MVEEGEGFGGVRAHQAFQTAIVIFAHRPARAHICSSKARTASSRSEARLAALDGLADIDTVMRAVETVSAYATGAIRREIANLRAERATGSVQA